MRFILNNEKFVALCQLRGWRTPVADLARATGYSKSYVSRVLSGKEPVRDKFMLIYIQIAGVNCGKTLEWASLFQVCQNEGTMSPQSLNYEKFHGRVPYGMFSRSYEIRKVDDPNLEQVGYKAGAN